jgi:signal peptidase II
LNNRNLVLGLGAIMLAANVLVERVLTGVHGRPLIPGLADFSPISNHGVSFGLLTQNTDTGRYLLMAVLSVIAIGVLVLGWREQNRLAAAGYGLVLGGALGNLLDRALYGGGVFDFLALHLGRVPLFVCNFADIAITAGAILLMADVLLAKPQSI